MATGITAAELKVLTEKVCDHDRFIDGNGTKGAKERIGLLEQSVNRIESSVNRLTNYIMMLIITIGGSVLIWLITSELPKIIDHIGAN